MTIFLCVVNENDFCDFGVTLIGSDVSLNKKACRCHNNITHKLNYSNIQYNLQNNLAIITG